MQNPSVTQIKYTGLCWCLWDFRWCKAMRCQVVEWWHSSVLTKMLMTRQNPGSPQDTKFYHPSPSVVILLHQHWRTCVLHLRTASVNTKQNATYAMRKVQGNWRLQRHIFCKWIMLWQTKLSSLLLLNCMKFKRVDKKLGNTAETYQNWS